MVAHIIFLQAKDTEEVLILINQIICKFNSSASGLLEDVFPVIATHLSVILSQDAFSNGPARTEVNCFEEGLVYYCIAFFNYCIHALPLQEMRELQELQKTLYTFLCAMSTHDLSTVFLAPSCRHYLENIMQLLLITSCSHKEMTFRKVRFTIDIEFLISTSVELHSPSPLKTTLRELFI